MGKLRYLGRCLRRWRSAQAHLCCNCGAADTTPVDRKYLVTALRRCNVCSVLFRTPTDDPLDMARYYEQEYAQGFTTDLPDDDTLHSLKLTAFAGTEKDYASRLRLLKACGLNSGARLFDFGCSWGYGSYQLACAGYDVLAFELAPTRRAFATAKLAVDVVDSLSELGPESRHAGTFDCFFSSHVIEHVPNVRAVIELADRLLRPGGLFVSFTPNGSAMARVANPHWSQLWGEVHPLMIDDVFLRRAFSGWPRLIASTYDIDAELTLPSEPVTVVLDDLAGSELLFVARKPPPS